MSNVKILESKTQFNKMVYKVELEGEEKFWDEGQIKNEVSKLKNEYTGFGWKVDKFENIATVTIYTD